MKRIALIIPTLDQGGAEKQVCLLAAGLPTEQFETHVIVLTRTGPREAFLRERNIPVHIVGKRHKFDPTSWWRLKKLLTDLAPDLVHTWIFAANTYGRTAAIAARVPIVIGSERSVDPWKSTWQFWIDRYLAKKTRLLTTNSTGVVEFYAKRGIDRKSFTVIPNAVTPSETQPISRDEAAKRLGIDPKRKWIMSVGRMWPQKGYKDLIWTAETLRSFRGDTSYIVIGDGPERPRLELYRDNVKAASQVFFVGERTDVAQLLPHADLLWNGSLYEGQSNVILEAMLSNVAVIATDIPGNRDLIEDGVSGMLYSLGDTNKLVQLSNRLLENHETRRGLAIAAKQFVQTHHSIEAMIAMHVQYYTDCMKSK
ncbi:MAG: glycosyltransferase [Pirellula sp.]|jgi:glycosyltransferase involved in cell wall biosynthesis|nr:glycosyltransferase [Pirellula sp.]